MACKNTCRLCNRLIISESVVYTAGTGLVTVGIKSLPYVCGYCYTQLSDVQQEKNGFLTEERRFKVNPEKIRAINDLPEGVFWNKKGH